MERHNKSSQDPFNKEWLLQILDMMKLAEGGAKFKLLSKPLHNNVL